MPMLPSRHYISEHTQFMRDLIAKKPDIVAKQVEGRRIFWDKTPLQLADDRGMDEGRIAQPPYVYQTK